MTALQSLKGSLYPISSKLSAQTSLVEGTLKGTTGANAVTFRCLFVHNSNFNQHMQQRMFEGEPTVLRKRRIFIPTLRRALRRRSGDFDLCVAILPTLYDPMFRDLCAFKGREEVEQIIDTSGGWEAMRQSFSKKKRQTTNNFVERYGLSYRMAKKLEDFDLFYHRMHVPHIRKRYGELSMIDSYEDMKAFFQKGVLLFVTNKDDQPVAGALSLIQGKSLVFRRTGVLDGDETTIKGGAQTALYYFQLKYAADNGFHSVDTMKSAAFLNDGVYRHKAEWGARALPDSEATRFVYFFHSSDAKDNGKLASFFDANPLIVDSPHENATLTGVVGAPKAATNDEIEKRFHTSGLAKLLVYTPEGIKTLSLSS